MTDETTPPPSFAPSSQRKRPSAPDVPNTAGPEGLPPRIAPAAPRRSLTERAAVPIPPEQRAPQAAAPAERNPPTRIAPQAAIPTASETAPPPSFAPGGAQAGTRRPVSRLAEPPDDAIRYTEPVPRPAGIPTPGRPPRRKRRRWVTPFVMILAILLAWPIGLALWANGRINHIDALTGAPNTPGTTYLLAGSDSRADGAVADDGEGQRTDTILILHKAPNGQTALVSLPRDTYVDIPGHGPGKLNSAYAYGGPQLVTQTVEQITGLTIDHYVEIGMGGVVQIVDAVGGIELCLDYDVDDPFSGLVWTAGCHVSDGNTALAFARMRKADPLGDFGRQARQRQVIGAVVSAAATPATLVNPFRQIDLVQAGTDALTVSNGTNILSLGQLGLAFRSATGPGGLMGMPPIANPDYQPGGVGSTVLLDEARLPDFFARLQSGDLTPEDFQP